MSSPQACNCGWIHTHLSIRTVDQHRMIERLPCPVSRMLGSLIRYWIHRFHLSYPVIPLARWGQPCMSWLHMHFGPSRTGACWRVDGWRASCRCPPWPSTMPSTFQISRWLGRHTHGLSKHWWKVISLLSSSSITLSPRRSARQTDRLQTTSQSAHHSLAHPEAAAVTTVEVGIDRSGIPCPH